jgi:hypothetical protein
LLDFKETADGGKGGGVEQPLLEQKALIKYFSLLNREKPVSHSGLIRNDIAGIGAIKLWLNINF